MKLIFLIFAMALAAMGPARDAPPPEPAAVPAPAQADGGQSGIPAQSEVARPMSPEEVPGNATGAQAQAELREYAASEVLPEDFLWTARPVVVFADTPNDPAFREQMQALRARPAALAERDVVVITDADPVANSIWRRQLHPRGFSLVLIDKDGQIKLRKPLPWDAREIGRAIDKFPLRRQEIGRARVLP